MSREVVKKCTKCEQQIPVACKLCPLCKCYVTPAKSVKTPKGTSDIKVVKKCSECGEEIPVACKLCPLCKCQVAPAKTVKDDDAEIRRTERINRERPDFFNAMKIDNQFKKKRKRKARSTSSSSDGSFSSDYAPKRRRGRPRKVTNTCAIYLNPSDDEKTEMDVHQLVYEQTVVMKDCIKTLKALTQSVNDLKDSIDELNEKQ
ncbi:UPF0547 protein C16orf87 homolog [Ruditapes philippinarum]|uniref:UPF0547 protein C16orf87 homolog n=1 Tax=Ruditapes philippinarum TaxID=129788 RepID=UPI00295ABCC2|nr:UPF0547 protein C16orf87 homolog [Ruditapes philippinarum]